MKRYLIALILLFVAGTSIATTALTAGSARELSSAITKANLSKEDVEIKLSGTITPTGLVSIQNENVDVKIYLVGPAIVHGKLYSMGLNKAAIIIRDVAFDDIVDPNHLVSVITEEEATFFPDSTVILPSGQRQVYFGWPTLKGVASVKAQVLVDKDWVDIKEEDIIRRDENSPEPTINGWESIRYVGATPGETASYKLVATTEKGTTFESATVQVTTAAKGTLHSRPDAKATIYLDFDGYVDDYVGNASAARANYIQTPVFENRSAISNIWRSVAEDFSIFDVDVTTEEPTIDKLIKSDAKDDEYGKRVVFDKRVGLEKWYVGAGGVSGLGAFGFRTDRPAFIFGDTTDNIACQATHEISHTLGLVHDGGEILVPVGSLIYEDGKWTTVEKEYYLPKSEYFTGQRISLNCTWYPVMGGVPTANGGDYINQFSNGNYETATNTEDDFAVITGKASGAREGNVVVFPKTLYPDEKEEGFWKLNLLADDFGDTIETAVTMPVAEGSDGTVYGVISPNDVDVFSFVADKGKATIKVSPEYQGSSYGCSLDAKVELLDAKGAVLKESIDPLQGNVDDGEFRRAELEYEIASAGTYYVRVSGTFHKTRASMNTAYGSVGPYVLTINAPKADVELFMSEHWNQKKPSNDLMPRYLTEADAGDSGFEAWDGRAPTGCVATQMAQLLHFWQWPKRYENFFEPESPQSVAVQDKGKYSILLQANGQVPYVFDGSDLTKARLSLLAATLGGLEFNRNGTGGYPERVAEKLANGMNVSKTYYDYGGRDTEWTTAAKLLKAGFPLPATIPGHAIVIQGWKEEGGDTLVYKNNGEGGTGDGWISTKGIDAVYLFYPRMRVQLDRLPAKCGSELSVGWSFPEPYMRLYPTQLTGFRLTATSRSSKGEPEVNMTLGRDARQQTIKLSGSGEYDIEVTPIFSGGVVAHTVAGDSYTVNVTSSSYVAPQIKSAPKSATAKFGVTSFEVVCSETVETLELHPSIRTIHEVESFSMENAVKAEKKSSGAFIVTLNAADLPTRFNHQKMILTLEAKDRDWNTDYADVLVEFSTAAEGTDPEPDPEPEPETPPTSEEPENFVDGTEKADYILISPNDFYDDWKKYVIARARAHTNLTFAVKNTAEIYTAYGDKGGNPADMIKSYIAQQASKTKYFVLGAAWSDISSMDGKSEESFVIPGENGSKYAQLALSLDNTIPGFTRTFSGKTLATDYPYALVDGDEKPDVVVARIPLVPWPKTDGSVATFAAMIEGYGNKVAAVEKDDFSGTHRYACAGAQLGTTVSRGSEYWPRERHQYADGYYDFFDPRHPDSATDGMIAARRRFRDFFAMYNPVKGAMVIPTGKAATDFFDDKAGWEAIIAKCHGLEGEAYQTGITDARFRETSTLVKFGIFAMPCLTGRPDRTTTWNGWANLRQPSMGVAAVCNPEGGEVVGFHNTHDGAGKNDVALVTTNGDPYATQYEGLLLSALFKDRLNAGDAWMKAHEDYVDKHGTGTWHLWTAYESLLYGDPLVAPSAVNEPVCGPGVVVPKILFR